MGRLITRYPTIHVPRSRPLKAKDYWEWMEYMAALWTGGASKTTGWYPLTQPPHLPGFPKAERRSPLDLRGTPMERRPDIYPFRDELRMTDAELTAYVDKVQAAEVSHTPGPFDSAIAALESYVAHEDVEMCAIAEALEKLRVAPEMLEALKGFMWWVDNCIVTDFLEETQRAELQAQYDAARAAVAKAESR
jgi:hypothetical protein